MKLIFYVICISIHQSLSRIIGQYKWLIYISWINKNICVSSEKINALSEWVSLNANSAIFQPCHGENKFDALFGISYILYIFCGP
jgi:hypothetical protein